MVTTANKFLHIYYARAKECLVNTLSRKASLQKIRNYHSEFFLC